MKYAYIGLKITGGNPRENGIFQIGIILEKDGKIVDKFNCSFKPPEHLLIDDDFIKMYSEQGVTLDGIVNSEMTEKMAYDKMATFLGCQVNRFDGKDRIFFVSYNIPSSFEFFKEFCNRNSDNFLKYFWSNPLDLMTLAGELFKEDRQNFDNFGFRTVLKLFQELNAIEKTISIDSNIALWDAAMMYKMYKRLRSENIEETINFLNANG